MLIRVALFLILLGGLAWSQEPPPSARESGQPKQTETKDPQQPATKNLKGAEQAPPIVNVPPTPVTQPEHPKRTNEGNHKTSAEWWIAIFTGALVFATIILAGIAAWQGVQLKRSVDTVVNAERPYLLLSRPQGHLIPPTGTPGIYPGSSPFQAWARCAFINYGRSPGIIEEIRIELCLAKELPAVRAFTYSTASNGKTPLAKDEKADVKDTKFNRLIDPFGEEADEIRYGIFCFFLLGYIKYSDIFGYLYEEGFCLQHYSSEDFVVAGGKSYNYRKRKKRKVWS